MLNTLIGKIGALTKLSPGAAKWVTILLLVIVAAAILVPLIWFVGPHVPVIVWWVLLSVLAGLALVWLVFRGIPRYMEHRFMAKHSGDLSPGNASDEQAPRERMLARLEEAKSVWEGSPEFSSVGQPLYWIPFYMVLGDREADAVGLLQAAAQTSPFPVPQRAPRGEREWLVWWFHKDAVAIETSPDFACDVSDRVTRGIWYQALQLLRGARGRLPLNGFVLLVSANQLRGDTATVREYGLRLRRLIDEAMAQLQLSAPVYLVVTHLDQLTGGKAFLDTLPRESFTQAFGHLFPEPQAGQEAWQKAKPLFAEIEARLQAVRLGALMRDTDPASKSNVFQFVSEFGELGPGLETLTRTLFEENVLQRRIPWRGLFFTAGASGKGFIADLFLKFLPADQPLAQRSRQKRLFGWVSVFAAVGISALMAAFLVSRMDAAHREDQAVVAQADGACGKLAGDAAVLADFVPCHDEIVSLEQASQNRGFTFGLDSATKTRKASQAAFSSGYEKRVLAAIDSSISSALAQKKTEFRAYAALGQRIDLIRLCRDKPDACPKDEKGFLNAVGSPADFPEILQGGSGVSEAQAARLALAYLRWQSKDGLDARETAARQLLAQVSESGLPALQDVIAWGDVRSEALRATTLWRPGARSPEPAPSNPATPPSPAPAIQIPGLEIAEPAPPAKTESTPPVDGNVVPGSFRKVVAQWIVGPVVRSIGAASAPKAEAAKSLERAYGAAYFAAWANFLTRFPADVSVWTGNHLDLAQQMLEKDNPYTRLMVAFRDEVRGWEGPPVPAPPWVAALEGTVERESAKVAAAVREVIQVATRDVDGRASYDLARLVFSSSPQGASPALDAVLAATPAVEKPSPADQKIMGPGDYGPWSAAQGPLRVALQLLAYRTTEFLDQTWTKEVVSGMRGKAPKDQIEYLLGGAGRLKWFHDTWLKPFVGTQDGLLVSRLGVSLPINTDFQAYVRQAEGDQSKAGGGPINAGVVQVFASGLGAVAEGATGTVFELTCQGQKFAASSKGASLADTRVNVFWSPKTCLDATIRIALPPTETASPSAPPPSPAAPPLQLVKTYAGSDGFLKFVRDFKTGSKVFRLQDFADSYSPAQWKSLATELARMGVGSARVNMRVEPSPDLDIFMSGPRPPPTSLMPARLG